MDEIGDGFHTPDTKRGEQALLPLIMGTGLLLRVYTIRRILLIVAIVMVATGCDTGNDGGNARINGSTIDIPAIEWLKQNLIDGNVEPRLVNGLLPDGFYQPLLAHDWTPKPQQKATLISQARFIYVMAMGYEITGNKRYLAAMQHAADYLLNHFSDPDIPGQWYRALQADGHVGNRGFHAYGNAQVIFALAHAYKITQDAKYLDAAMSTWLELDISGAIADTNKHYDLHGLNAAMHIFESLIALYKASDRSKLIGTDVNALAKYIVGHFYDPKLGVFVEELTPKLERKPDGEIRLGHAIEIAFLLSRAVDAGLPASYLEPANASVDFVARQAAKHPEGLIPHTTDYQGNPRDPTEYWWSQTELLRGLAHFSLHRGRNDLNSQFNKTFMGVRKHFIDPHDSGWYKTADGITLDKGEPWKAGYHVTMMLTELMRLKGMQFLSGNEVL